MSYKTIVVHLDCGERRSERLGLSVEIAAAFDAHLLGVFALDTMRVPAYALAEAGPAIMEIERRRRADAALQAEREFRERVANRVANAEWRTLAGDPVDAVTFCARCADLVVIGQLDPETYEADCVPTYFVQDVVLGAGKPVLIVPFAGHFGQVGWRAMVAWNASREASRAVWDALPLLKRSEAVELVSFDANKTPIDPYEEARNEMKRYLARHAVNATASRLVLGEISVGDAILSRAADLAADSIVMGAYGHSRLRERVLGGATRTVLDSMTVPVLMSH